MFRLDKLMKALLLYCSVMAFIGTGVLSVRAIKNASTSLQWMTGVAVSVFALGIFLRFRDNIALLSKRVARGAEQAPDQTWIAFSIGLGILLRLLWIAVFPSEPVSDGATYVELARKVIGGLPYFYDGTHAYWPPGYPFALAPFLLILPTAGAAITTLNLLGYVIGGIGVWRLGMMLSGSVVAKFSVLLYTVWPNLIMQAGLPEKEQLLAALMPWILALGVSAITGQARVRDAFMAGGMLGAATLVQPALQLFPAVLLAYWLTFGTRVWGIFLALLVGMAIVLAPWTTRNYVTFDRFVLVSTNGGVGLYGANNPDASGGYLEKWPKDLMQMPELQLDAEAKRRALAWIRANPVRFLTLVIEKNIRFMGDDAGGAYHSLGRGVNLTDVRIYAIAKGICNAFWLCVWFLIAGGVITSWHQRNSSLLAGLVLPLAFLYFLMLHSVFESAGKYHVVTIGVLCVLIPFLWTRKSAVARPTDSIQMSEGLAP